MYARRRGCNRLMRDILVIGAGGRVGKPLMASLGQRALGVHRRPTPGRAGFDLANQDLADVMSRPEGVTHAIILAGITSPEAIVAHPSIACAINVEGTLALVDRLFDWEIIPVFISSDAVLGLSQNCSNESTLVRPQTLYGQMKRQVEEALVAHTGDWLILRLPRVYGLKIGDGSLITSLCERLLIGGEVPAACDQKFNPIYIDDVTQAIEAVVDQRLVGLYHLGGAQTVTNFEVAELVLLEISRYRSVTATIKPCSINDFVRYETRPCNIAMDSGKITTALGLNFMNIKHACHVVVAAALQNAGE